jgi:hypothetical protein
MSTVYVDDRFVDLLGLLCRLKVVELKYHEVSYARLMIAPLCSGHLAIPSHWIQVPGSDMNAYFVEIVPAKKDLR